MNPTTLVVVHPMQEAGADALISAYPKRKHNKIKAVSLRSCALIL